MPSQSSSHSNQDMRDAREAALNDVLTGRQPQVPPGLKGNEYITTFSLARRMLPHVQNDVANGRLAPPEDPGEHEVYLALYAYLRPPPLAYTAETTRLSSPAPTPRQTRRCPDCQGDLQPICLIDRISDGRQRDLEYTAIDVQPDLWTGALPTEGRIEPFLCTTCGRILLYGWPRER
jgi:hypothetical protein